MKWQVDIDLPQSRSRVVVAMWSLLSCRISLAELSVGLNLTMENGLGHCRQAVVFLRSLLAFFVSSSTGFSPFKCQNVLAVAPISWHNHHAAYIHSFEKIYTRCVMRWGFWVWPGLGKIKEMTNLKKKERNETLVNWIYGHKIKPKYWNYKVWQTIRKWGLQ